MGQKLDEDNLKRDMLGWMLTVTVRADALRRVDDCLWKSPVEALDPLSAFPFTRTTKAPDGIVSKRAKNSPPPRVSTLPFTSPDPDASTSETSVTVPESLPVRVKNRVPLPPKKKESCPVKYDTITQ